MGGTAEKLLQLLDSAVDIFNSMEESGSLEPLLDLQHARCTPCCGSGHQGLKQDGTLRCIVNINFKYMFVCIGTDNYRDRDISKTAYLSQVHISNCIYSVKDHSYL